MKIPKIIHFIWAGGDDEMPDPYANSVRLWEEQNPSFELWLWVDQKSAANETSWRDTLNFFHKALPNKVILKDIEKEKWVDGKPIADEYIRYEIDKLKPNYGASSDLLRYKILFRFGGAYFDFDITPGTTSLENSNIFNKTYKYHCLYVHNNSQNTELIGNDAFICTPDNQYMRKIYETAINHYTLRIDNSDDKASNEETNLIDFNSPDSLAYCHEDHVTICKSTPLRTGPLCTRLVVDNKPTEIVKNLRCCYVTLCEDKYPSISTMNALTLPFELNGGEWQQHKRHIDAGSEKLIVRIKSTIKFECERLKILRLDDHVKKLIKLARLDDNEASDRIISLLNDIDLSQLMCIQLTFLYSKTINFCRDKKLMEKTFLFPLSKSCQDMVDKPAYYKRAVIQIMSVNLYTDINKKIKEAPSKSIEECDFTEELASSSRAFLNYALNLCESLFNFADSELKLSLAFYLHHLIHILKKEIIYQLDEIYKATKSENFNTLKAELIENTELIVKFTNEKNLLVDKKIQHQKITSTLSPYNLFHINSNRRNDISQNDEKYEKSEIQYPPQLRSNIK